MVARPETDNSSLPREHRTRGKTVLRRGDAGEMNMTNTDMDRIVQQFRVRWKRVGLKEKRKLYWSERAAQRLVVFLGPEPWKALGKNPDDRMCCDGHECGCDGQTWRENLLGNRGAMPPLEYMMIETRKVTQSNWMSKDILTLGK